MRHDDVAQQIPRGRLGGMQGAKRNKEESDKKNGKTFHF